MQSQFHSRVVDHAIKDLCRVYISRTVKCEFCGNQRSEKAATAGLLEQQYDQLLNFETAGAGGGDVVSFQLTVNGREHHVDVPEGTSLLEVLRNDIGDKSPKFGCGLGQCGACVVWIGGHPTPACDTPVEYVRDDVQTLAGLGHPDAVHPVQSAFLELQAAQCGYCIAGIIMRAAALLRDNPRPTRDEVSAALESHLCRCGTHSRFVDAVLAAAGSKT